MAFSFHPFARRHKSLAGFGPSRSRWHVPKFELLEDRQLPSGNPPFLADLHLVRPSGDNTTDIPLVAGRVVNPDGPVQFLPVQFNLTGDGLPAGSVYTNDDGTGNFVLDLRSFVFAPGQVNLRVRAGARGDDSYSYVYGNWQPFTFTYQVSASGSDARQQQLPPRLDDAKFDRPRLEPSMNLPTDLVPLNFTGGAVFGGQFTTFAARFSPPLASNHVERNDTTPFNYGDAYGGTYTGSRTEQSVLDVVAVPNGNGTWTYDETWTSNYVVTTTYTNPDGTAWNMSQDGHFNYVFHAQGGPTSSSYTDHEDRYDDFGYTREDQRAFTDGGGALHTIDHVYNAGGTQSYIFDASGARTDQGGGKFASTETWNYVAGGKDNFTNAYGEKIGPTGTPFATVSSKDGHAATWDYQNKTDKTGNPDGTWTATANYVFNKGIADSYNDASSGTTESKTSQGGVTTHDVTATTTTLDGIRTIALGVTGKTVAQSGGQLDAATVYHYVETIHDDYGYSQNKTTDTLDQSEKGAAINVLNTTKAAADRHRDYAQTNDGTTTTSNATITFAGGTDGVNATKSNWNVINTTKVDGVDTSTPGYVRSFIANRSNTDSGTGDYRFESKGDKKIDAKGVTTVFGTAVYTETQTGVTSWNNSDSSKVDGNVTDKQGSISTTTVTTGTSSSTDSGTGNYTAFATGTAINYADGSSKKFGSTNHSATSAGTDTGNHNYTSKVIRVDTGTPGVTKTTNSTATTTSVATTDSQTDSKGNGSYLNATSTASETTSQTESGTTHSTDDEVTQVTVVDQNTTGIITNSDMTTTFDDARDGKYSGSYTLSTQAVNDVPTASDMKASRTETGTSHTITTTVGTSTTVDKSVARILITTVANTNSSKDNTGNYSNTADKSANLADGKTTSSQSGSQTETDNYVASLFVSAATTAVDTTVNGITKNSTTTRTSQTDTTGTSTFTAGSAETTDAAGTTKSTATTDRSANDTGKTVASDTSTSDAKGTRTLAPGVTQTFSTTSTYQEDRTGTFASTESQTTATVTLNAQVDFSSKETIGHTENGNSIWSRTTTSSSQTADLSVARVAKNSTNDTNSKENGTGTYVSIFSSLTVTAAGKTTSSTASDNSSKGASTWDNSTLTTSDSLDQSVAGVTAQANSKSDTHDTGTGNYSSETTEATQKNADGSSTSKTTTVADSTTTGKTVWSATANSETDVNMNKGGITTTAKSQADLAKSGNETFTLVSHDESQTVDGKRTSLSTTDRTEDTAFSSKSNKSSNGTVTDQSIAGVTKTATNTSTSTENSSGKSSGKSSDRTETYADGTYTSASSYSTTETGDVSTANSSTGSGTVTDKSTPGVTKSSSGGTTSNDTNVGTYTYSYDSQRATLKNGKTTSSQSSSRGDKGNITWGSSKTNSSTLEDKSENGLVRTGSDDAASSEKGAGVYASTVADTSQSFEDGSATSSHTESRTGSGTTSYDAKDTSFSEADDTQTPGVAQITTNGVTHTEGGTGTYSSKFDASTVNGKTTSSKFNESDGDGTFTDNSIDQTTYTEAKATQFGGTRTVNSTTTSTTNGGGTVHTYSLLTEDHFPDGTWASFGTGSRDENGDTAWTDNADSTGSESGPDGQGGTRSADSTLHSVQSGSSTFTSSSKTTNQRYTDGTSTSMSVNARTDSGKLSWSSTNVDNSKGERTTASGSKVSASGSGTTTETGSGTYTANHQFTHTVGKDGRAVDVGSSTRTDDGKGNTTLNKADSSSTSRMVNTPWGTRTTIATTQSSDVNAGDYTYSSVVNLTASADGSRVYSGAVTRTENKNGNTTSDKTMTYADSGTDNSVPGISHAWTDSKSITHGSPGDYTSTTQRVSTVNPDGSESPFETTTSTVNRYSNRAVENKREDKWVNTTKQGVTVTTMDTVTTTSKVVSGQNDHIVDANRTTTSKRDETTTTTNVHSDKTVTPDYTDTNDSTIIVSLTDSRSSVQQTGSRTTYTASVTTTTDTTTGYTYTDGFENKNSKSHLTQTDNRTETVTGDGTGTITVSQIIDGDSTTHEDYSRTDPIDGTTESGYSDDKENNHSSKSYAANIQTDGHTTLTAYSYDENSGWEKIDHTAYMGKDSSRFMHVVDTYTHSQNEQLGGTTVTGHEMSNEHVVITNSEGNNSDKNYPYNRDINYQMQVQDVLRPQLGPGSWGEYFESWVHWGQDMDAWFSDYVYETWQSLATFVANPGAAIEAASIDVHEFFADGSAADLFFGFVDGTVKALNPFDAWVSVPEIGPVYGHTDLYGYGQIAGTVTGIAIGIVIGNAAAPGSGLVQCGSLLQKFAKIYTTVETVTGVVNATSNIAQGKAGLGDALAFLPLISFGLQKLKGLPDGCFVAGTLVVMAAAPAPATVATVVGPADKENGEPSWRRGALWFAMATVPIALAGYGLSRRRRPEEDDIEAIDLAFTRHQPVEPWAAGEPEERSFRLQHSDRPFEPEEENECWTSAPWGAPVLTPANRFKRFDLAPAEGKLAEESQDNASSIRADHSWNEAAAGPEAFSVPRENDLAAPAGATALLLVARENVAPEGLTMNPVSTSSRRSRRRNFAGLAWLSGWLALGGLLLLQTLGGARPDARPLPAAIAHSAQPAALNKPIEQVRVGDRVKAHNPELKDADRVAREPDPATWRHITLRLRKPDGGEIDIEMLRPADWLRANDGAVGQTIDLEIEEMGVEGSAEIQRVDSCPPIQPGFGQVVTATFAHAAKDVIDIHVEGVKAPIGCTANHPFWSEDRQAFVPAGQLRVGETLRTVDAVTRVVGLMPRGKPERVYNLEVNLEHVYYVSTAGVLVHNACNSKILGDNLEKWGQKNPLNAAERGLINATRPADTAAHHIVAAGSKNASQARTILQNAGYGINNWENGIFLAKNLKVTNAVGGAVHSTIHTNKYYAAVTKRLQKGWSSGQAAGVKQALDDIAHDLLNNNVFW